MFDTLYWLAIVAGLMFVGLFLAVGTPAVSLALLPFIASACLKAARAWAFYVTCLAAPIAIAPRRRDVVIMPRTRRRRVLTPLDICAG